MWEEGGEHHLVEKEKVRKEVAPLKRGLTVAGLILVTWNSEGDALASCCDASRDLDHFPRQLQR